MRFISGVACLSLLVLAGCASAPDAKSSAPKVAADTQSQPNAVVAPKSCIVGSKICTKEKQVDPSVLGMSGDALGDAQRGHPMGFSAPNN